MPGLKDNVSVKGVDGSSERKQKFLILSNLKEAYQNFKEKHPTMKIGFSKFAQFCPKECVLPCSSGTHSVCVCTKHHNVKLMMAAIVQIFQHDVMDCSPEEPGPSTLNSRLDTIYICHYMHVMPFSNVTHHRKYVSLENVAIFP